MGTALPLLSVVTPAFNSARFIGETLDSVAKLDIPHEHIVIDGGSTDGTVALLEGRDDPSLSWVSEADRGQTHAVNKGLALVRGELIGWLNADDAYISDAVERSVRRMVERPELDAVFGGMHVVNDHGAVRRRYQPSRYSWRRFLFVGDYIPTPTIIFRRELLDRVGMLDERYTDAADYDFFLRLFHGATVERRPEAIVRFRYHAESKSARQVNVQLDEALEIRRRWARGRRDRAVMDAIDRIKRLVLLRLTPWPRIYRA